MKQFQFRFGQYRAASPPLVIVLLCILAAAAFMLGVLLLWVRGKTPITAEMFTALMEDHGFEVISIEPEEHDLDPELFLTIRLAINAQTGYQIEYYQLSDGSTAKQFHRNLQASFEAKKGSVSSYASVNLWKFGSYSLTTNGSYYYSSYIGDTLVLAVAEEQYKAEIKNIVKEIGY